MNKITKKLLTSTLLLTPFLVNGSVVTFGKPENGETSTFYSGSKLSVDANGIVKNRRGNRIYNSRLLVVSCRTNPNRNNLFKASPFYQMRFTRKNLERTLGEHAVVIAEKLNPITIAFFDENGYGILVSPSSLRGKIALYPETKGDEKIAIKEKGNAIVYQFRGPAFDDESKKINVYAKQYFVEDRLLQEWQRRVYAAFNFKSNTLDRLNGDQQWYVDYTDFLYATKGFYKAIKEGKIQANDDTKIAIKEILSQGKSALMDENIDPSVVLKQ